MGVFNKFINVVMTFLIQFIKSTIRYNPISQVDILLAITFLWLRKKSEIQKEIQLMEITVSDFDKYL